MQPKGNHLLRNIILSTSGVLSVSTGIFLLLTGSAIFEHLTNTILTFRPNSTLFDIWEVNDIPLPLDFYMFNWTNPDEVHNDSIKPRFEQLGPYRFLQKTRKVGIVWNDNGTITYRHHTVYHFDDKFTKRSLSDTINTLNPMAVTAVYRARDWSYVIKKGLSYTLRSVAPTLHVTKTVGELLFDGYDDPLLSISHTLPFLADANIPDMDKFAWFRIRNNSEWHDGVMNMGVAQHNFGVLKNWNYQNSTNFYQGDCGRIHGSAGQLYKRPITKSNTGFFSPDLCRYVPLDYEEEVSVKNILGHKYAFGKSFLANGTEVPENSCYCTGECIPSGVKNISNCRYGTPSFASLPNFYKADPYYTNLIEGVVPNKEMHESYMVFEPVTGIPLSVNMALQINLLLQPIKHIALYEDVPRVFFPVLWFKQSVEMPDDLVTKLYVFLKLPLAITICAWFLISLGLFLIVCLIYKLFFHKDSDIHFRYGEEVPLRSEKST